MHAMQIVGVGFEAGTAVAQHRPQHVNPVAGQAQNRLAVDFPSARLLR